MDAPWYNKAEAATVEPAMLEEDNWNWAGAQYAAKQPRPNAQWNEIVYWLGVEIDRYFAFLSEAGR
jgi:hypothetical protein